MPPNCTPHNVTPSTRTEPAPFELVLASHNRGKLAELTSALAGLPVRLRAASECGVSEPEEGASSFVENALIKARHAALVSGLPALADDSGLCVDALGGAPGVRSARYAGAGASDADNNAKLLAATDQLPGSARGCRFVCVLVLVNHADDPLPLIAEGLWEGRLLRVPRGNGGFGYDPIFADADTGLSAAELSPAQKLAVSHRGKAIAALQTRLLAKLAQA